MKFNTALKPNTEVEKEETVEPEGYDEMRHCLYCGRVMCDMLYGGEVCGAPYKTNFFNKEVYEVFEFEDGVDEAERAFKNFVLFNPLLALQEFQNYFSPKEDKDLIVKEKMLEIPSLFKKYDRDSMLWIFDKINKDADLQFFCYRLLKEKMPEIKISELKGFDFEETESLFSLNETDIERMKEIYSENYKSKPKLRDSLLKSFDQVIKDELSGKNTFAFKRRFQTVRFNGGVVGFFFFEYDDKEDVMKFKSFNVDPRFAGRGIGNESLNDVLESESAQKLVKAESLLDSCICSKYLENFGFVGTSVVEFEGEKVLNMIRNDYHKELSKFKDFPEKHLFTWAQFDSVVVPETGIKIILCKSEKLNSKLEKHLQKNCLLTRNIKYATEEGQIFNLIVIEELSDEDYQTFMSDHKVLNSGNVYIV